MPVVHSILLNLDSGYINSQFNIVSMIGLLPLQLPQSPCWISILQNNVQYVWRFYLPVPFWWMLMITTMRNSFILSNQDLAHGLDCSHNTMSSAMAIHRPSWRSSYTSTVVHHCWDFLLTNCWPSLSCEFLEVLAIKNSKEASDLVFRRKSRWLG